MIYLGVDTAATISAAAARILKDNGVSFVGRYLVPPGMWKDLKAEEIKGLHDAGLAILLCWEIGAGDVKGGAERGRSDGARAKQLAESFGVPAGTSIFFACDYGAPESDYSVIEQYIRAAQEAVSPYEAGIYGHAGLVDYLAQKGACRRFWQCVAWSLGRLSQYTSVYQYAWSGAEESKAMQAKVGFPVDMNKTTSIEAAGLWMPEENTSSGADAPPSPQGEGSAAAKPWYARDMAWAEARGYIRDGRPNDPVTRAELATVLRRMLDPIPEEDQADRKNDSGLLSE